MSSPDPAPTFAYAVEPDLTVEEFASVLVRSTLAERRPMEDLPRLAQALEGANLIVTARAGDGTLVGVSRALTDYAFSTYLADLAVDAAWQGYGIGRELIRQTHEAAGLQTMIILLAAPKARTYYPHVGMRRHDSCWIRDRYAPALGGDGEAP